LDAAATVFAKRGFHGASLDEIAETAGYTRGAIYKHFADKEELLHEVCVRLNERAFAEFDDIPAVRVPIAEFVDGAPVVDQWRSMNERDAEFRTVMLEYTLHAIRDPRTRERALEFARENQQHLADYIRQHAKDVGEELPLPADDIAGVFGVVSDGFAQLALLDPAVTRLFGVAIDLIARGIRSYAREATDPSAAES
jgi:AcrR family transcriptional regulator